MATDDWPPLAAFLFDAGGVLVLPDPAVLGPALAPYGADPSAAAHARAHYGAMAAKSRSGDCETVWDSYNLAYVRLLGVAGEEEAEAALVLGRTRHAHLWRAPIAGAVQGLHRLADAGFAVGVVSNASGQIESVLRRFGVCQVGPGEGAEVRCVVDSDVVGVAKPNPAIFGFGLAALGGIPAARVGYVGDSVVMDIEGARSAGLHPFLVDPFDDWPDADFDRVLGVMDLARRLGLV